MMLPSRLGCPLSLKTPNMGNTGYNSSALEIAVSEGNREIVQILVDAGAK